MDETLTSIFQHPRLTSALCKMLSIGSDMARQASTANFQMRWSTDVYILLMSSAAQRRLGLTLAWHVSYFFKLKFLVGGEVC